MITAIVQARMTSSRLPGKVMMEVLGRPMIGYLLKRLKYSRRIEKIVVAAPEGSGSDGLCDYLFRQGVSVFRGSEQDVLDRYYQAAVLNGATTIIRITADCPLMDPAIIDEVIVRHGREAADYTSNIHPRTFPDGMDVEVFSMEALSRCWRNAIEAFDREHVTAFMRRQPGFRTGNVCAEEDFSPERWTLDYEEDFVLIKDIIENVLARNMAASMQDILAYKKMNPGIFRINQKYVPTSAV